MMMFVILGLIFGSALTVAIGQHFGMDPVVRGLLGVGLAGFGALLGLCAELLRFIREEVKK